MGKPTWILAILSVAAVACDQSPPVTEVEPLLSNALAPSAQLTGTVTYFTYAAKSGEILQNAVWNANATAELLEHHQLRVTLDEYELGRVTVLEGQLTPGGVVKMVYVGPPANFVEEIVKAHTGCTISGGFPVYHGTFSSSRLTAETSFSSQCPIHWEPNDIFPTPVDGPVHWKWIIDMTVSQ